MKFFMLPVLASLAVLLAFTDNNPITSTDTVTGMQVVQTMPLDTPRIKHFARIEVKKTTGKVKGMVLDDVMVYIINGKKYFDVELGQFKLATIKADEMIITPVNDANAKKLYGGISMKGVIEFKNARLIPPMVNLIKNRPLFVLDGEEQKDLQQVKSLDPGTIAQIVVLKGDKAVSEYGSKGKNGAVEIRTYSSYAEGQIEVINQEDMEGAVVPPPVVDEATQLPGMLQSEESNKVYEKLEIDAEFKGGEKALSKYLDSTLKKNIPVDNGASAGNYRVMVQMIIDKEGNISDLKALTNYGFGMEEEALRVLKKTNGLWKPAVQNGRPVKAYKKQPVTFVVQE